jgi:diguanylate cyclase (GGDEF)-like protein
VTSRADTSFVIAPFDCEFRDAGTERAFLGEHLARTQAQLRGALSVGVFFFVAFGITDLARLGWNHDAISILGARLLLAAVTVAGLGLTWLRPLSIAISRAVPSVIETLALLVSLLIVLRRPAEMPWHAMSMSIVLIVIYVYIPNRPRYAMAAALPASVIFLWLAWQRGHMVPLDFMTMAILLGLTNLFGAIAARRYQKLWREEFRAQSILKNLAVRDPLTGCFNRRHLHQQLMENEIARASRYGLCLSVIMCDIDHFKRINDEYGHYGGDAVLCAFADLLLNTTRNGIDSVVRFGGEEFLLILPETDLTGATLLAERLRLASAALIIPHDARRICRVTASFGVAARNFSRRGARTGPLADQAALRPDELIASADALLYAAKHGGRNQVCSRLLE